MDTRYSHQSSYLRNKVCSTDKAVNGFKAAGICPYNPNIFSDDEFYVEPESLQNDVEMGEDQVPERDVELSADNFVMEIADAEIEHLEDFDATEEELINDGFVVVEPLVSVLPKTTTFSDIVPLPTASNQKKSNRKPREKQHSKIMTSPQFKIVLDEKRQRRDLKQQKKLAGQAAPKKRGRRKKTETKKTEAKKTRTKKTKENGTKGRKKICGGKRGSTAKEASNIVGTSQGFEHFFINNLSLVETTGDSEDSE